MMPSFRTLACLAIAAHLGAVAGASAQTGPGRLTGRVTDDSGAALPGVTVTIASSNLKSPVVAVTGGNGQYLTPPIPPDTYTVTFELTGFETRIETTVALRPGDVFILDRQLGLASLKETVEVIAPNLVPPEPPKPRPETPKRPQAKPVPPEVLASVCGPRQPSDMSLAFGTILGHRDEANRRLYGNNDILVLDVGLNTGVSAGQNFVAHRRFRVGDKGLPLKQASFGEDTAALIQVVEAYAEKSIAVVVYACGELMAGDSIEPFDAVAMWTPLEAGKPQFEDPARIIIGDHGKIMGSPHDLMVIDRGTSQGAQRGQRLTIFRRMNGDDGPVSLVADAIIVAVRAESATIRIERASDAVNVGDMVALHR